ncbi:hypothetical protein VB774_01655 [Pseudanabaena galeata UHCC 0370]|uniref:Uncharacterized protein n=1 Tax=Pseudanabaena galeata UHCC 0370 TaxID=3110310 RepID=A0ABU5TE40_9CYAN|nr:hypothetical protein [Pseudanabaena galeata]MEA5476313.1 hypothetical protein [Pseudanabaena galeata UHCC 0370]
MQRNASISSQQLVNNDGLRDPILRLIPTTLGCVAKSQIFGGAAAPRYQTK